MLRKNPSRRVRSVVRRLLPDGVERGPIATAQAQIAALEQQLRTLEARQAASEQRFGPIETNVARTDILTDVMGTTAWVAALPPADALVSVVMPTHNRSEMVRDAIRSVQRQSHENWELIIVDDASHDDTPDVLRSYDDPRIRPIRCVENAHAPGARNAGLAQARGQYVAYLDDDNLMGEHWLRGVVWAFETFPQYDVVYGTMMYEAFSELAVPQYVLRQWDRQTLVLANFIDQGTLAHRATLPVKGFDRADSVAPDWDFLVRATVDRDALPVPITAVYYRTRHEGRITGAADQPLRYAQTQQRFSRRGPLRVLVAADEGSSVTPIVEALAACDDDTRRWSANDGAPLGETVRAWHPDFAVVDRPDVAQQLAGMHVPVIVTDVSAFGDQLVLGDAGLLAADGSARATRGAILDALDRLRAAAASTVVPPQLGSQEYLAPDLSVPETRPIV